MTWPFPDDKAKTVEEGDNKPPTSADAPPAKTPAEIIAESLKPLAEGFTKLNARLDTLEQNTRPRPKSETPPEQISVLDDENAAFAQRIGPVMLRQLELEARVVKNDIKAEYASAGYGELWAQFETEINQVIDGSPIVSPEGRAVRGDPQYIRNVVDMVMGRNARKAGMRFDGKSKGFFLETGGSGADGSKPPVNDGLNDGQRKVFSRMKVSMDDAKKVMSKLKFVTS
jgi:hypothetical protein